MDRNSAGSLAAAPPPPSVKWLALALWAGVVLTTSACGQKGALYLQPAAPAASAPAPAR